MEEEKKTLYSSPGFRFGEEALTLHSKTMGVLRDIFDEYYKKGYSPREISHVMQSSAVELELIAVLEWPDKKDKEDE